MVPPVAKGSARELGLRVVSALVLAPLALAAVYVGGWAFTLVVAAAALAMVWEWNRLCGGARLGALLHGAAVVAAIGLAAAGMPAYALAAALALAAVAGALALASERMFRWVAVGIVYLSVPVVALIWLRAELVEGRNVIVWMMAVVWATDIGGYAVGRAVGGPRLAPRISPNKTWAGALGGSGLAALVGVGAAFAGPGIARGSGVIVASLGLSLAAQVGDLAESAVKRHFHAKQSGGLIPGHGGMLDRVDGLLLAAPLAAGLALGGGTSAFMGP
jgi:phosphatidate cytidylyltransferase